MSAPVDNFQPPATEVAPPAPRPTKLRIPAIVLIVLGLAICGGGIAKIISGGIGTGAAVAFLGIVLVALSFVPLPVIEATEAPLSPLQRLTGIFFEPTRVFRNLRIYPRWVAPYIAIVILSAVYTFAFTQRVTPERIVNHTVDKLAEMGPPFAPPASAIETMRATQLEEAKNPVNRAGNVLKAFAGVFVFSAILAALYLLGSLAFGGRINFWQAFCVVLYGSLPIIVVQKLLGLVLLYLKAPEDIHPILGQATLVQDNLGILVSPANHPVIFVLAASIGILSFYGLWLKATGLKNTGTRVSSGVAWGVAITFWILGLLLITGVTALFPTFIS